ncbi:hypothetical protein D3C74_328340 [compost metagenome]
MLEGADGIAPAQRPVLRDRVGFPSQLLVEIQRLHPGLGVKDGGHFAVLIRFDVAAGFKQEVGPVPARFIAFAHRSDPRNALLRIGDAFGYVVHVIPSPVERWSSDPFIVQQLLVDYGRSDVTVLGDPVHLAVNDKLVLQHRVNFVLVLPVVPQLRDVGNPAAFDQELGFRCPSIVEGWRFVGRHLHADFVDAILPVVLHDRYVRVLGLKASDFIVLLLAECRFVRQRIVDFDRNFALRDVIGFSRSRFGIASPVVARGRHIPAAIPAVILGFLVVSSTAGR